MNREKTKSRIVVVSTQRNAGERARACLLSVARQEEEHQHVFFDDGSDGPTQEIINGVEDEVHALNRQTGSNLTRIRFEPSAGREALQNVYEAVHALEPDTIVCWVDGDDHLAHPAVLSCIRQKYEANPELALTYGQFVFDSGGMGWASEYPSEIRLTRSFRNDLWRATHLKTFRAGLFQKIRQADLMVEVQPETENIEADRRWITHAIDLAIMFPMLEMAACDIEFVPLVLYVYTGENGGSTNHGTPTWNESQRIRGLPKYERLTERPW